MNKQDETLCYGIVGGETGHMRHCYECGAEAIGLMPGHQRGSTLVDDLTKLQADVHRLREDYRDNSAVGFSEAEELDARLNKIEATVGTLIEKARGRE